MRPAPDDIRAHAYVDGELDPAECAALLEELSRDPARGREVAGLFELKALMRHAFEDVPGLPPQPAVARRRPFRSGLRCALGTAAALLLLVAAFAVGWAAHGRLARESPAVALAGLRLPKARGPSPGVLLHLASLRKSEVAATLRHARLLLDRYRGRGIRVEVVVNGMALEYLAARSSPYGRAFARLMERHPNLSVVACGVTLAALRNEGQLLPLLHGVRVAPSAVREVVKRLEQGWTYVQS